MTHQHYFDAGVARRRRKVWELIIASAIAAACVWAVTHVCRLPDDDAPPFVEQTHQPGGDVCPAGYEDPEPVSDDVVRCTLKPRTERP